MTPPCTSKGFQDIMIYKLHTANRFKFIITSYKTIILHHLEWDSVLYCGRTQVYLDVINVIMLCYVIVYYY